MHLYEFQTFHCNFSLQLKETEYWFLGLLILSAQTHNQWKYKEVIMSLEME